METARQRILYFIENQKIEPSTFLKKTGLKKGFIDKSHQLSGATDIYLAKILDAYPSLNADWLVRGKGPMLIKDIAIQELNNLKIPDKRIEKQEIPLYNFEATAGLRELFNADTPTEILDTIKIPNLPRCDGAITITGDSMYPLLKSGDMVLYAKTSIENIFYGEMYLIGIKLNDTEEFVTVKYIHKSDIEHHVKLVSQNTYHASKDIPVKNIIAIALVKASIRINTML